MNHDNKDLKSNVFENSNVKKICLEEELIGAISTSLRLVIENTSALQSLSDKTAGGQDMSQQVDVFVGIMTTLINELGSNLARLKASDAGEANPKETYKTKYAPTHRNEENIHRNDHISLIGNSKEMKAVFKKILQVAWAPTTIMITGATGTGKEVVASLLHAHSPRCNQPFIAVNCSAIPDNLFESEMFGIERGVATGVEQRLGYFEMANKGTLFLDEIGELPLRQQTKLLRPIETRRVARIGSKFICKNLDIRFIVATNTDLKEAVFAKKFREDLYYRLNVVHIHLPPLSLRSEDIPLLANYFMSNHRKSIGKPMIRIHDDVMDRLMEYNWPGNCRELNNIMEHAAIIVTQDHLSEKDLPPLMSSFSCQSVGGGDNVDSANRLALDLKETERSLILKTLELTKNNKSEAAHLLGISREGLRKKMIRGNIKDFMTRESIDLQSDKPYELTSIKPGISANERTFINRRISVDRRKLYSALAKL